jgi:uncharacterized membrane protein YbhN (UPF0104 family)
MKERLKRGWPVIKWVLAVVLLVGIGWQLAGDLSRLNPQSLTLYPEWLLAAAGFYLAGLGCSGIFWYRLLRTFGERPDLFRALCAYYISHLGKYIPGKALALVIRGTLIQSPRVKLGVAIIAAFYEVLTTMASGALLAALLFTAYPPTIPGLDWNPVLLGLLLSPVCIPLLPGVFNRLVRGLATRFQKVHSFRLPALRLTTLLEGLLLTGLGWTLLGLSLWALQQALLKNPPTWSGEHWARCTGMVSLAYVAGFLALVVPSGVGVREFVLLKLLPGEIPLQTVGAPEPIAAALVLMLRVLWTATELVTAGVLFLCLLLMEIVGKWKEDRGLRIENRE